MKTLKAIGSVFLYYVVFFVLARLLFFVMNWKLGSGVDVFFTSSIHGLQMDLSTAGYLTILNATLFFIGNLLVWSGSKNVLHYTNKALTLILAIFVVIDARLYAYWGYHIDGSILEYLKTPKEAMASANFFDWLVVVLVSFVFTYICFKLYRWIVVRPIKSCSLKRVHMLTVLVIMGALIIPIRGGFDVATMNVSKVYYSTKPFANHVAMNSVWNGVFSLVEGKQDVFHFMDDSEALEHYTSLYSTSGTDSTHKLEGAPNVIVIVLESFTANVVQAIGGIDGITPNLNKWMGNGLSFENCYASGDRSDKGLTTLFTGFPALPNARLLSYPNKLDKVPNVYNGFKEQGYQTSFYYGGNLDFANIKLLFSDGSVDRIIDGSQVETPNKGKWGVRDEDMFDRFYSDLSKDQNPFFATLYTLSSHEPFDIPAVSYQSDSLTSDFYKAIYYTDSCFGVFMGKLSRSKIWANTVVVVTADHGVKNPGNLVHLSPRKFRVPLLFTGGAIKQSKRYTHYCSHTDIPLSLESLLLENAISQYPFGKSVFDSKASFALYYYVLGSGMINENGCVVYDIGGDGFLVNTTNNDSVYHQMQKQILGVTQYASTLFNSY